MTINPESIAATIQFENSFGVTVIHCHSVINGDVMAKLEWTVNDKGDKPLMTARREDVLFMIYYQEPDLNNTARWTLVIMDHGEIMRKTPPRLEPRTLMNEAEQYEKWKREL